MAVDQLGTQIGDQVPQTRDKAPCGAGNHQPYNALVPMLAPRK